MEVFLKMIIVMAGISIVIAIGILSFFWIIIGG
jgi:hypothetical protein